jgi:hypothetical protein
MAFNRLFKELDKQKTSIEFKNGIVLQMYALYASH